MKMPTLVVLELTVAYLAAWALVSQFASPFLAGPLILVSLLVPISLAFYMAIRQMEAEWLRWSVPAYASQVTVEEFALELGMAPLEARMIHSMQGSWLPKAPTLCPTSSGALIMGAESWFRLSPAAQRFGIANVLVRRKLFPRKQLSAWRSLFTSFVFGLTLLGTWPATIALAILICTLVLISHYIEYPRKAQTDRVALALTGDKEAALEFVKHIEVWPKLAKYRLKRIAAMPCD